MLNRLDDSGIIKLLSILLLILHPLCITCYPTESIRWDTSRTTFFLYLKAQRLAHNLLHLAAPPFPTHSPKQFCGRFNSRGPGLVGGAKACIAFLRERGSRNCHVTRDTTQMCGIEGSIKIIGMANPAKGEIISRCSDVADAVQYVVDHCSTCAQDNCSVEGTLNKSLPYVMLTLPLLGAAVANGNGDFLVMVTG